MTGWFWRAAFAPPVGFALYAIVSHIALLGAWPLPRFLFPLAMLFGCAAAIFVSAPIKSFPAATDPDTRIHKVIPWLVAVFFVGAFGTLIYGAVATPDREWDGLVSWSLRARYFAPPADLGQLVFQDPAVYAHSFNYPVLQPLCLGSCQDLLGELPGRLLFPAVFAAFVALVAATAREVGLSPTHRHVMVVAFGATPMWYSTGSGAVDSGYAELLMAYFLTVGAAGILTGRAALLACAALCLPLVKPEGMPYGALLTIVTVFGTPRRRLHAAATIGLSVGMALWLPLQAMLNLVAPGPLTWLLPVATAIALLGLTEIRLRCGWRPRTWILIGAGVLVLLGASPLFLDESALSRSPLLNEFVSNLVEVPDRLGALPIVCLGYVEGFFFIRKFGLLYVMVLALLFVRAAWTRGASEVPHRGLLGFFLCGVAVACLAIFLGENTDWDHVFRSRFYRLLLQWVGVGWLLLGQWMSALWRRGEELGVPRTEPP